jgi:hypothetical protein
MVTICRTNGRNTSKKVKGTMQSGKADGRGGQIRNSGGGGGGTKCGVCFGGHGKYQTPRRDLIPKIPQKSILYFCPIFSSGLR